MFKNKIPFYVGGFLSCFSFLLQILFFSNFLALILKPLITGFLWTGLFIAIMYFLERYVPEIYNAMFSSHQKDSESKDPNKGEEVDITISEDNLENNISTSKTNQVDFNLEGIEQGFSSKSQSTNSSLKEGIKIKPKVNQEMERIEKEEDTTLAKAVRRVMNK